MRQSGQAREADHPWTQPGDCCSRSIALRRIVCPAAGRALILRGVPRGPPRFLWNSDVANNLLLSANAKHSVEDMVLMLSRTRSITT